MWQIFFSSFSAWQHLHLKHSLNINEKETFLRGDHQILLKIYVLLKQSNLENSRVGRKYTHFYGVVIKYCSRYTFWGYYKTIKLHLNNKPPSGSQEGGNSQAIGRSWNKSWSCYFFCTFEFYCWVYYKHIKIWWNFPCIELECFCWF